MSHTTWSTILARSALLPALVLSACSTSSADFRRDRRDRGRSRAMSAEPHVVRAEQPSRAVLHELHVLRHGHERQRDHADVPLRVTSTEHSPSVGTDVKAPSMRTLGELRAKSPARRRGEIRRRA